MSRFLVKNQNVTKSATYRFSAKSPTRSGQKRWVSPPGNREKIEKSLSRSQSPKSTKAEKSFQIIGLNKRAQLSTAKERKIDSFLPREKKCNSGF
jgi:hypothetical protein